MEKLDSDTLISEKIADIAQSVMHLNLESDLCYFLHLNAHIEVIKIICSKSKEEYNEFIWTQEVDYSIDTKNDIGLETECVIENLKAIEKELDEKLKEIREVN